MEERFDSVICYDSCFADFDRSVDDGVPLVMILYVYVRYFIPANETIAGRGGLLNWEPSFACSVIQKLIKARNRLPYEIVVKLIREP